MAQSATNIRVGSPKVGAYAYSAILGTTAPTDVTTALAAGFNDLGYVSDAGLVISQDSKTVVIKDWNNDTVATLVEEDAATFKLTLLQTDKTTMQELYGTSNVTLDVSQKPIIVDFAGGTLPHKMYAFQLNDNGGGQRFLIEDGQITKVGDIKLVKKDVISYDIEITCYRSAAGRFFRRFIVNP